jgi:hypothetical protein
MSASTTQPMAGHANQSAPLGAIAILVGALALGAVGIALGTTYKAAPAAGAVSPQAALEAQRKGEIGGSATMDYALRIQRRGEIGGSAVAAPTVAKSGVPSGVSGPRTRSHRGHPAPLVALPVDAPSRTQYTRR